jgi:hypothetical protein
VRVQGFTGNTTNNILVGTITALTAGKMTIGGTDGDVIVDDAAGESVTISKWVSRRATVQDLVNIAKTYTDSKVAGLSWKQAVRAATTGAGTLASSFENGDTIDGVTLATGDRILIKNQAAQTENGIYTVNASGAPSRASDADSGAELVNATCYVSEGSTLADTQWTCNTNAPITIGATNIAFAQLTSGGGGLLAANNLSDVSSISSARSNLGLAIGTDVQGHDAALDDLAGITFAQGDILYFDGSNLVKLAAGTAGKVLQTNGSGANPSWVTPVGGSVGTANYSYQYTDPAFANVSALLHFNGTNGSTTITDQVAGNSWTAVGSAVLTTSEKVYGTAGLSVPSGSNSSVKCNTSSKFDVATSDWSLEFQWKYAGAPQTFARMFATRDGDTTQGICVTIDSNSVISISMSSNGASTDIISTTAFATLSQTAWNSIIIQRRGKIVECFLDGTLVQTFTIGSKSIYYNSGDVIVIGGNATSTSRSVNGYFDEFRFTKGAAVMQPGYAALPTGEFPNS